MKNMTKGQIESKISETITKLKTEYIGKGPREVKSYILEDIIVIRLRGGLTILEKQLSEDAEGIKLVKMSRIYLLEKSKNELEKLLKDLLNVTVTAYYADINPKIEEMFIILDLNKNIEEKIIK